VSEYKESVPEKLPAAVKPSQATDLLELAQAGFNVHMSTSGEPFAVAKNGPNIARMLRGGRESLRAELSAPLSYW
jgi:hypothetical protein